QRASTDGSVFRWSLPAALTEGLRQLAGGSGTTLFAVLSAALSVWLSRLTSRDDVVIGLPVSGRTRPELEDVVGFFVNTLVLRAEVNRQERFLDLLGQVRDSVRQLLSHQDTPFQLLPGAEREALAELLRVSFAMQPSFVPLALAGCHTEPVLLSTGSARFDLTFLATERDDSLDFELEYKADLFKASTVERWVDQYTRLLEAVAANPATTIGELPVLTPQ